LLGGESGGSERHDSGDAGPPSTGDGLDALRMQYLRDHTELWAGQYRDNSPYPHIVIDNFISDPVLDTVLNNLPASTQPMQRRAKTASLPDGRPAQLNKRSYSDMEVSQPVRDLLWQLNSSPFLCWLELVTGIGSLLPDPMFNGAGVHVTDRGGLLRVHADFNKHPKYMLDRRVNLLLYLNRDWEESYGGALELWDPTMSRCEKKILPIASRCVIFSTTSTSFHGHPHPVECPENMSRKSIALYYYTNGRPAEEQGERHATLWRELPEERGPG
jgi:Rps23 Pro-64 3,4-dihydroxylase Tpa1-like proline 4-hydroxylase